MNTYLTKEDIQKTSKHMKRCTTYLIRELQIKSAIRYHYTPITIAQIQNTTSNAGKDVEQQELSFIDGRNAKWHRPFGK